ncbi:MAG: hypothetical protein WA324_14035 [Bryobacteraceae bacterium]
MSRVCAPKGYADIRGSGLTSKPAFSTARQLAIFQSFPTLIARRCGLMVSKIPPEAGPSAVIEKYAHATGGPFGVRQDSAYILEQEAKLMGDLVIG